MGGRTARFSVALELVTLFLTAEFSQDERHLRRLAKVSGREQQGNGHE
jgi:ribose 5-phosphate isomerase RpiB